MDQKLIDAADGDCWPADSALDELIRATDHTLSVSDIAALARVKFIEDAKHCPHCGLSFHGLRGTPRASEEDTFIEGCELTSLLFALGLLSYRRS